MSSKARTTEQCKKILFNLGIKLGVSPRLISERMLSAQDKCDMLNGEMTIEALEASTELWRASGMPDLANGTGILYANEVKKGSNHPQTRQQAQEPSHEKCFYRKPFVCPEWKTDCHRLSGKTCR
jgi:hypothetical protein